jgi:hypothetical protein
MHLHLKEVVVVAHAVIRVGAELRGGVDLEGLQPGLLQCLAAVDSRVPRALRRREVRCVSMCVSMAARVFACMLATTRHAEDARKNQ